MALSSILLSWRRAGTTSRSVGNHPLFETFDVVIVQVDADVAGKTYGDDQRITHAPGDLPCERPCPPASDSTDSLRTVMLGWMGEANVPPKIALCTPSKSLETWILAALFPENQFCTGPDLECRRNPETQLQRQSIEFRLIRGGTKVTAKYLAAAPTIAREWPRVRLLCPEAERFPSSSRKPENRLRLGVTPMIS